MGRAGTRKVGFGIDGLKIGNAKHVGIGTDLDGGFGTEQKPSDLDTIADLRKLPEMLAARGYDGEEVAGVMSGNFLGFLRDALPID